MNIICRLYYIQYSGMNSLFKMITIFIVVIILAIGINYIFNSSNSLRKYSIVKEPHSGKQTMIIPKSSLPNLENGYEATYSLWYYIDEVDMSSTKDIHILHIGDSQETLFSPGIYINPIKKQLIIRLSLYTNKQNMQKEHTVILNNIEIKSWTHLAITVKNDIIEVYVNGLLERTSIAPGIPKINEGDLYLSKNRNFKGQVSNIRIIPYIVVPNSIKYIYSQGPIYKWWYDIL